MFLALLLRLSALISLAYCSVNPACPAGTISHPENSKWCYKLFSTAYSFDDAEFSCQNIGGHLTEINDQITNNFIVFNAKKSFSSTLFWTGGQFRSVQNTRIWAWTRDTSYLTFFDWFQPDSGTNGIGSCISVNSDDGYWRTSECSDKLPFVCQIPAEYSVNECESEWTYYSLTNKCYKVFALRNATWDVAAKSCISQQAHLVSIHSQAENDFIGQMTTTLSEIDDDMEGVRIGFHSDSNYQWSWTDSSPADYTNWGQFDPDHTPSFCVVYAPDGYNSPIYNNYERKWNAIPCDLGINRYICKKDAVVVLIK